MSNLALNLIATATRIPDRTAAIRDEQTMTYAELEDSIPTGPTGKLLRREVIPPPTEEA
jgi:non-ribosomal peptide synthetase component F